MSAPATRHDNSHVDVATVSTEKETADDDALTRAAEADPDSPPMTDTELAKMQPASVVLPKILGAEAAAELLRPRRPGPA